MQADIGVVGLAVMGQNLILNLGDHGFNVVAHNRSSEKIDDFLASNRGYTNIQGAYTLQELVAKTKRPRKILLMVKAGEVVDAYIEQLVPLLEAGDVIIDGGNSHYADTNRRVAYLTEKGLHFIGAGISGGEEGARHGPSIMPGGDQKGWPLVKPILQSIAAKTAAGDICCDWVGKGGAGHFVKMVHNGIEYGDMQLICEVYDFMKTGLGLNNKQIADVFSAWNSTELASYLIQITADICAYRDNTGAYLLDDILDSAGQKGTGKWTLINATNAGVPLTLIGEAVQARFISALYQQRQQAAKIFAWHRISIDGDQEPWVSDLGQCLLAAKIISYAQGFMLMHDVSREQGWEINLGHAAMLWRAGCIIRSGFLDKIQMAYRDNPALYFLGESPYFRHILETAQSAWRRVVSASVQSGIAMPCISAALTFMDSFTRARLPANLLQAQRDYFGAHTYERIDQPRGHFYHMDWTGQGGNATSNSYSV